MNTIDIIITALFVVGYIVLAIAKKNKQKNAGTTYNNQEIEEPTYVQDDFEENTPLAENLQNSPKTEDFPYFTYDNLALQNIENTPPLKKEILIQNNDIEEVNNDLFDFSSEEVRKGIIFSEIIKRPYFE